MTARRTSPAAPLLPARSPRPRGPARTSADRDALERCARALSSSGRSPTPTQLAAFSAVLSRDPVLVTAPTGSGKTAAVLLPLLARRVARGAERGGRVVVVAPVRALVESLGAAVTALIDALGGGLRVATRTGDTPAKERRRIVASPPDVLITTPESLAVLLATDARASLAGVGDVVLDELHLLVSGKRGALLGATLACLDAWSRSLGAPAPRRLGMSATAEPVAALAAWLGARARVVGEPRASVSLSLLEPASAPAFPAESWTWRSALPTLARAVASTEGATLVFVSSRTRAERWSIALRDVLPARMGVGCYHGSLSAEARASVAAGLRDGSLKVVVATSALEVGVDLPRVTQVVLLGAPSSLQRATQAAGRADHRPGAPAAARVLPLGALDLLQGCAAREALAAGAADRVEMLRGDLDVAAQAALGRAALGPCAAGDLASTLRASHAFASLSDDDLADVTEFLTTGGDAFAAYPEMARLARDGEHYLLASKRSLIRYLRGVGTILSEVTATVVCGAQVLGELQGRFAQSLEAGDRFALAGRGWRVVGRGAGVVYVRPDAARDRALPAWEGGSASLSPRLSEALESLWDAFDRAPLARDASALPWLMQRLGAGETTARGVLELLRAQRSFGALPSRRRVVVELIARGDALHVVAHTFAGRGANEVIARAVAVRARRDRGAGADVSASDLSACAKIAWQGAPPDLETLRAWLAPEGLREALCEALDDSSLGAVSFREVARVAQLWLPDARKGAVTPGLLYDVLRRHDPDHVLLRAQRHTLWTSLEGPRAEAVLADRAARRWEVIASDAPSPLAVPALAALTRDALRPEDLEASLLDAANALYARSLARGAS